MQQLKTAYEKVKGLFVGGDRKRPYLTFVEGQVWWIHSILFLLFFVFLISSLVFLAIFQPDTYNTRDMTVDNINVTNYFNGTVPATWTVRDNKVVFQELLFSARFENKQPLPGNKNETAEVFGYSKDDLLFQVTLTGEDPNHIIFEGQVKAYLRCKQNMDCERVTLLRVAPVFQSEYTITVYLLNGAFLYESGLVTSVVGLSAKNVAQEYTTTSLVLRVIFLAASTVFTIAYIIVLVWRQHFKLWASEQRFTVVLLVLTILYNNPIFWLEYMNGSWVFPFISTLFIVTFICFLLLSLLVFTHSVITIQSHRHLIWFYAPKWIIVGILWVFLVVVITLFSVTTSQSASSINTTSLEFIIFSVILSFLFAIYFLTLLYYFVRVVSKIRILPGKNRKKFIFTWLFTGTVIILTITDLILYAYGNRVGGSSYNAFFFAYNLYTFFISILFWPASNESSEKEEERERVILAMSEESEFKGF